MQQSPATSMGLGAQPLGMGRWRISPARVALLARALEWGAVLAALGGVASALGVTDMALAKAVPVLSVGLSAVWLGLFLTRPAPGAPLGGYDRPDGARLWALLAALGAAGWSTLQFPAFGLLAAAAVAAGMCRVALAPVLRAAVRRGRIGLGVVVVGGGAEARATLEHLDRLRGQGVRGLGLFDDRDGARSPPVQVGVPRLGRMADLPDFIARYRVDMVIVTMPPRAEDRILQILAPLWVLPVDIRLAPHDSKLGLRPRAYRWLGDIALLDLFDRPLRARDAVFKRSFDLVIAAVLTLLALPVMAVIALAIRLDSPGPILFRQHREGYIGKAFTALKFRSLHHDRQDAAAVVPVARRDGRVTRIGRILRRTSLDELPQLFNVLAGDMSLVGPRPHAVGARSNKVDFAAVAAGYAARHKVKPGLTGLAQVRGLRGAVTRPEDIRRRLACDLDYIDTWSPWLDLRILVLTLPAVLRGENAF